MKKIITVLLMATLLFSLASCGNDATGKTDQSSMSSASSVLTESIDQTIQSNNENASQQSASSASSTTSESGINVDKGLLDVKITLPKSFVDDSETAELTDEQKSQGFKSIKKNEDGSVTYTISKSAHKSLMEEMKKTTSDELKKMATDGTYSSIKEVTFNDNFSKITLLVDEEKFNNSFDGLATLAVGMSGMMYQIFDGTEASKISVTVELKNNITQEVFSTVKYPDAMNE